MQETIRQFLNRTPPRKVPASFVNRTLRPSERWEVRLMRVGGMALIAAGLLLPDHRAAWEDWQLDRGTTVAVNARVTGFGPAGWREGGSVNDAVRFEYALPDGALRQGYSIAPAQKYRLGQSASAEVHSAKPELVRLLGTGRSAQGSSTLWLIPIMAALLPVIWRGSWLAASRDLRRLLRHATWVEAEVTIPPSERKPEYPPAGMPSGVPLFEDCTEVQLRYQIGDQAEIHRIRAVPAVVDAMLAQKHIPLLVLPPGKELERLQRIRVVRPETYFPGIA